MITGYIDSHAHLADSAFDADRDEVLASARAAGCVGVVCIGETLDAASRAAVVAARHPGYVWHTAGVHPHDAATFDAAADTSVLRDHVARGAVAIGECGLDYHYDHSPRERQRAAFAAQLALARELALPVVVHTREAEDDTAAMVAAAGREGIVGVLHCFTGTRELARVGLDAGWLVSFSGIITFKRWDDLELLRMIPGDRLLVESDAPYLAPVPNRGKRNHPAWVVHTLERLATVRGDAPAALARRCADNARRLFKLPPPG